MPEYETIPAEEENAKPKSSLRRVIVCAAALSFVLGAVAATAVGIQTGARPVGHQHEADQGHRQ